MKSAPTILVDHGDAADIPDLIAIATVEMPEMDHLKYPDWWSERLQQPSPSSLILVARIASEGSPIGFVWADPAAAVDWGLAEPWWCINTLTVSTRMRRQGAGRSLVERVIHYAEQFRIVSLYGVCYPLSRSFWQKIGFEVTKESGDLLPDRPVRLTRGHNEVDPMYIGGSPGEHMFVRQTHLGDVDTARLLVA